MTLINYIEVTAFLSSYVVFLVYITYKVQIIHRRVERLELSAIREIHEHDPDFADKVMSTQREFYLRGGLTGAMAMKEARRLYGLE